MGYPRGLEGYVRRKDPRVPAVEYMQEQPGPRSERAEASAQVVPIGKETVLQPS